MAGQRFLRSLSRRNSAEQTGISSTSCSFQEQLARNSYTAVYMYLVNVVFAGTMILNCGNEAQKRRSSPSCSGGLKFCLCPHRAGGEDQMHDR